MVLRLMMCLIILTTALGVSCAANPYGVAGYGVLTQLGMPADSWDYNWNWLQEQIPVEMCRPNHYYSYIGIQPGWFQYNQDTGQINDPAQFTAWVTAHPGKIWIMANEPDLVQQDGLTVEQYVDMYHTYYTLIKSLDPTAKFCIGAMSGGSTAAALVNTKNWYQSILNRYKQKYGVTMPIDIWNVHSYIGPLQIENPDKIINEYVTPFVNWCHTVENGAYAGREVWITELPIGEWMGAVSVENVIWFMQRYLPRLEQTGVTRWFWYVSSDWDGSQGSCPLINQANQVTPVGAAYAALANSYPNPIIPVTPFVPDPTPGYFGCDFSGPIAMPWFNKAGYWKIENGNLRHTGIYPWNGTTLCLSYFYVDSGINFRMKINSAPDSNNWGGVVLRAANRFHTCWDSGYLVLVRQNGELALYNKTDGTVASVPGGVAAPGTWHNYRVNISGYNIKVYVDDVLKINWTDPNQRFVSGYTLLQVHRVDASYDDFMAIAYPTPLPQVNDGGAYTYNTQSLPVSWTMPDTGAPVTGYKYAVGTSSGAGDILGWTYTTATSADIPGSFNPGTTYYVSVKAIYTGGLESGIGSSDGIVPVVGAPNAHQLKEMSPSTYALLENVVVSGAFSDCAYVQAQDRSNGIRVNGVLGLAAGDIVSVAGNLGLSGKEAALTNARVFGKTSGQTPKPLGMNNRSTGGSKAGIQAAVVDDAVSGKAASGAPNVGLLVKTSGQVTYVDPAYTFAYIDDGSGISDGSGHKGIRLALTELPVPKVGAGVVATGCCGAMDVGGKCARYLRPRSRDDVWFSELAKMDNLLANSGFESGILAPWSVVGSAGEVKTGNWYFSISAHSGSWFYGALGNYTIKSGALYQSADVGNGTYQASVWSYVLHGVNDADAVLNRIGIDPTGGTDSSSANVLWSDWDMQDYWYAGEWKLLITPQVTVTGGRATVFLDYKQQDNTGWHINCFDDVRLFELQ